MIAISGIGHCSSLGITKAQLIDTWLENTARPSPVLESIITENGPVKIPVLRCPEFSLADKVAESVERRMSQLSKMCFSSADEAMIDAQLLKRGFNAERTGLVVGTAYGNLDFANQFQKRLILQGPLATSPNLFTSSVHSSLASYLAVSFGIRGPTSTVTIAENTTHMAMRTAYDWLQQGLADEVLVTIGDEICDYHLYHGTLTPFKPQSEGSISFVLSKPDLATQTYAHIEHIALSQNSFQTKNRAFYSSSNPSVDFSKHENFEQHSSLYGSLLIGSAFELALAAAGMDETKSPIDIVEFDQDSKFQIINLI